MDEQPKPGLFREIGQALWEIPQPAFRAIEIIGEHVILAWKALSWLPRRPFRSKNYLEAADYIGVGSLPIILLVGTFTGMVTSLQSLFVFRTLGSGFDSFVAGFTGKTIALEMGPVLTALMLSGRVGAGIATELGTMRITEQIDALESMAVNPLQFLVLPRIIITTLLAPMLALLFLVVGMGGSYFVAVVLEGVSHGNFVANFKELMEIQDIVQGLLKAAVFGFAIALVGCYQGFHAKGGGRGVGIGTTRAVVIGSVSVLVLDYFLTEILLTVMPRQQGVF